MAPLESKNLSMGDRVYWQDNIKDQGKVVERDWSGVKIQWDTGKTTFYHHNDMGDVTRLPVAV